MLEHIIQLDQEIFYFINKSLANPATDFLMPILTHLKTWLPLFIVFCVYQVWKGGLKGRLCLVTLVIGVIICDQITSSLIKELVSRPRPCHFLSDINLLVGCGPGKSFPSSHASNSMMAVTVIALFFRKHRYWLPWLSILIGLSRIFVGVHFPFDVLVGWILGVGIGFFVYWLVKVIYIKKMGEDKWQQITDKRTAAE